MLLCKHSKEKIVCFTYRDIVRDVRVKRIGHLLSGDANTDYEDIILCTEEDIAYNVVFHAFYWCSCCGARFSPCIGSKNLCNYVEKNGLSVFSLNNSCSIKVTPTFEVSTVLSVPQGTIPQETFNFFSTQPHNQTFYSPNLGYFDIYVPSWTRLEGVPPLYTFGDVWMSTLRENSHKSYTDLKPDTDFLKPITKCGDFCQKTISAVAASLMANRFGVRMTELNNSENGIPFWHGESGSVIVVKIGEENICVDRIYSPEYLTGKGRMAFFSCKKT